MKTLPRYQSLREYDLGGGLILPCLRHVLSTTTNHNGLCEFYATKTREGADPSAILERANDVERLTRFLCLAEIQNHEPDTDNWRVDIADQAKILSRQFLYLWGKGNLSGIKADEIYATPAGGYAGEIDVLAKSPRGVYLIKIQTQRAMTHSAWEELALLKHLVETDNRIDKCSVVTLYPNKYDVKHIDAGQMDLYFRRGMARVELYKTLMANK